MGDRNQTHRLEHGRLGDGRQRWALLAGVIFAFATSQRSTATPATSAPAPAAPPRVETDAWVVTAAGLGRAIVGQPGELELTVETRAGYHLNDAYPLNVHPAPSGAATFEKARVARADGMMLAPCASEPGRNCRATVRLRYTPTKRGPIVLGANFAFSACDADRCLIEKVDVAAPIEIFAR